MSQLMKSESINALRFNDELLNIAQSNTDLNSKIKETIDLWSYQLTDDGFNLILAPTELQHQVIASNLDCFSKWAFELIPFKYLK